MVGIVVVSHSRELAEAAVALALQMAGATPPKVALASGLADGAIGTDAVRVADAIRAVADPHGVLVLMDLGSAVMSAEMALEFTGDRDFEVRLTSAPFVEGLLAAVVVAAGGGDLAAVTREAENALTPKRTQLGLVGAASPAAESDETADEVAEADVVILNPIGLHARPAALIVQALKSVEATVTLTAEGLPPAACNSPLALMLLGAKQGARLRLSARGPAASQAVAQISALFAEGFGEMAPAANSD